MPPSRFAAACSTCVLGLLVSLAACAPAGGEGDQPAVAVLASAAVTITPVARLNFQPDTAPVPAGYTKEIGAAYDTGVGRGWIRQDSLAGTHVALDNRAQTRDRNRAGIDQLLDTLIHMQLTGTTPGAFEYAVPAGTYRVKVSVGDQPTYNSTHRVNVEGTLAINNFVSTAAQEYRQATVDVTVSDGRLTIDATGGGINTKLNYIDIDRVTVTPDPDAAPPPPDSAPDAAPPADAPPPADAAPRPSVRSVSPVNGATGVNPTSFVSADINLPNVGGIDEATLTSANVFLARVSDGALVPAALNTSGGADVIVLQPSSQLAAQTQYRFTVTDNLRDISGARFIPFTSTFTTGNAPPPPPTTFQFTKVSLGTAATGFKFTSITIGPDNRLYAATVTGEIRRFDINADGTLANPLTINSVNAAEGASRVIVGLAFDPAATAGNLILWVTHGVAALQNAPDWTSKISKLTGPTLGTVQHVVVNLPRSAKDHLTNSIAFKAGEPAVLYINQGSMSATGAPDNAWSLRAEHLLSGSVLRLDTTKLGALPLNVKTEDGGSYNPFAANAPLTIYATGVRNAYDLVWHSNGDLYVPTNGSAAGGNTPATPAPLPAACANRIDGPYTGPSVPARTSVGTQRDYLFRVVAGGYYGHPNPLRCEWVLNGGNPTSGADSAEVPEYPTGTLPDRNWRGNAFDFGEHYSPNGVIEYKNAFFGSALQGKLLVVRYSGGDDVVALTINPTTRNISALEAGAPGMTGFVDPLDIVEHVSTGNLYVTEHAGQKIVLLRPTAVATLPSPWASQDIGAVGVAGSATHNAGTFTVKASGADIYGTADAFHMVHQPRSSNFTITARVATLQNTNAWAKAGVMIRETLAAGSKHAHMLISATNGAAFQRRTATNGTSANTGLTGWPPGSWVRLRRSSNTLTGFVSSNGTTWTQVGSVSITMASSLVTGLAVTSHNNSTLTTATFSNVTITVP